MAFMAQFGPQGLQERSQTFARELDAEHPPNLRAQRLAVAGAAPTIDLREAHADKSSDFGRELAMATPACQRLHQLLRVAALEGLSPPLHGFTIHPEVSLQRQAANAGVVEPGDEQLKSRMPPILRHNLE
jgi:hypothetical protein